MEGARLTIARSLSLPGQSPRCLEVSLPRLGEWVRRTTSRCCTYRAGRTRRCPRPGVTMPPRLSGVRRFPQPRWPRSRPVPSSHESGSSHWSRKSAAGRRRACGTAVVVVAAMALLGWLGACGPTGSRDVATEVNVGRPDAATGGRGGTRGATGGSGSGGSAVAAAQVVEVRRPAAVAGPAARPSPPKLVPAPTRPPKTPPEHRRPTRLPPTPRCPRWAPPAPAPASVSPASVWTGSAAPAPAPWPVTPATGRGPPASACRCRPDRIPTTSVRPSRR